MGGYTNKWMDMQHTCKKWFSNRFCLFYKSITNRPTDRQMDIPSYRDAIAASNILLLWGIMVHFLKKIVGMRQLSNILHIETPYCLLLTPAFDPVSTSALVNRIYESRADEQLRNSGAKNPQVWFFFYWKKSNVDMNRKVLGLCKYSNWLQPSSVNKANYVVPAISNQPTDGPTDQLTNRWTDQQSGLELLERD